MAGSTRLIPRNVACTRSSLRKGLRTRAGQRFLTDLRKHSCGQEPDRPQSREQNPTPHARVILVDAPATMFEPKHPAFRPVRTRAPARRGRARIRLCSPGRIRPGLRAERAISLSPPTHFLPRSRLVMLSEAARRAQRSSLRKPALSAAEGSKHPYGIHKSNKDPQDSRTPSCPFVSLVVISFLAGIKTRSVRNQNAWGG